MLNQTQPGLPAHWYYDPDHFSRELEAIWQRQWFCVGRQTDWVETGSYQLCTIGDQRILVVRNANGELNAFHDTCRHRGSTLCTAAAGKFNAKRIVCPYHAWSYSLEGELLKTPQRVHSDDFDPRQFSLYRVELQTWGGFVFINLAESPRQDLMSSLGQEATLLRNWPLQDLKLARREIHDVACNWKVFWENYLECYHCPGIHPELCKLVPVYGQGLMGNADLAAVGRETLTAEGRMLREAAETWAVGGHSGLPPISGLDETDINRGMSFATLYPGIFVVAHRDYVRSVRVLPLEPEKTRLTVDWLLPEESMATSAEQLEGVFAFGRRVVQEDAYACELNQKGLRSIRHRQGVLLPQEYDVLGFDNWVREQLGEVLQPAEVSLESC